MKLKIIHVNVKRALSRSGLPDLDYALNPYIGCYHGCIYCYARLYTRIREISMNWGGVVGVKDNLLERLSEEVRILRRGVVGVGTITDPYQPVEALYKLTRRALKILLEKGFEASIQTKNTLILRDIDLLVRYRGRVDVGFTITSLDDGRARLFEPKASPPTMRAKALKILAGKSVETWIFYGPVIPGYNDDYDTRLKILELARDTGSRVLIDKLHVKEFMYSRNTILHDIVENVKHYNWSRFYDETLGMCRDLGVECIPSFYEPRRNQLTLDNFTS